MRIRAAVAVLALLLGSCAHHPRPAGSPAPAATSITVPGAAPPSVASAKRVPPPPAPPAQAQHAPLWLVRGAVVDAHSGRPLDNAAVVVQSRHDSSAAAPTQPSIATGADGRFTLDFPAPGEYQLKVAALGYRFKTTLVRVSAEGDVPYRVFRLSPHPLGRDVPVPSSPNP